MELSRCGSEMQAQRLTAVPLKKKFSRIYQSSANFHRLREPETQSLFRREHNFLVASKSGAGRARACASRGANGSTFASAGQCPNQCTRARAAANESSAPLALALQRASHCCGLDVLIPAIDGDRIKPDFQKCPALEVSHGFCGNYGAVGSSPLVNQSLAIHSDRLSHSRGKALACVAGF